jgi:hypothetical protein
MCEEERPLVFVRKKTVACLGAELTIVMKRKHQPLVKQILYGLLLLLLHPSRSRKLVDSVSIDERQSRR